VEGILIQVVEKAKPSLPEFRFADLQSGYDAFVTIPRYSMGFRPQYLGDEEIHVATITITQSDDGFDLVVKKERITHKLPLTFASSGRSAGDGAEPGGIYRRIEEAAEELVRCLRDH
jgi:hypothetical protein